MAAGCIAGGIEATCVWPMEFIKTQLQLNAKGSKLPYNGMISGLTYTVKTTGKLAACFYSFKGSLFSSIRI